MYDIKRLHTAMLERGLSVLELAEICGRNEATIRQLFKRGHGRPRTVKVIANALKVDLKEIVLQPKRKRSA